MLGLRHGWVVVHDSIACLCSHRSSISAASGIAKAPIQSLVHSFPQPQFLWLIDIHSF